MGSSVSSNKSNWWVYLVVFLGFICFYLRYWIGRSSVDPLSTIIKTSTFEQLIQCSDINDSLECFNNFKGDLIDEVKTSIDSVSRFQLQNCLQSCESSNHDIELFLNIQSCFHQIDIVYQIKKLQKTSEANVIPKVFKFVLIFLLVFFVMYQIMQKELQDVQTQQQGEMNKVNEKLEKIRDDDNERIRTLVSIMSTAKNEIRSMKIQLTKDEEKLLDVDILAKMYLILKKDLKMLRKSLVVPYKELRVSEIIESESDFLQNYDEDISKSNANETQNSDSCTSNGKNFNDSGSASQVQISSTDIKKVIENHVDKSDHSTLPMAIVDPNEIVAKKGSDEKNNQGITNKLNFDIATPEGRDALKNYLHISRRNKAGGICNNSLSCISTESDKENISFAAPNKISTANACGNTYADIQRYDFNTMKKFRRVFIEGRGWVSMSKIEEEERIYGSSSIILNEVNN